MKSYFIFYVCMIFLGHKVICQESIDTVDSFRINYVNPGIDYEFAIGKNTSLSTGLGIGFSGAYRELTGFSTSGINYLISPFLDIQYKYIYNREKRKLKQKTLLNNSGNYFSLRLISRGPTLAKNINRLDNIDFAFGPTWGIQRLYGKMHFLLDFGPQYYFDTIGNEGFFPLMVQINIGLFMGKN